MRAALQILLPAAAALLALLCPLVAGRPRWRRAQELMLVAVCLLGLGLYAGQNWAKRRYFNPYEFFHYYVGSKYAPELGYTRLYDAAVLADRDMGFPNRSERIANLAAGAGTTLPEYKPRRAVYAEEAQIKAPFSAERWKEFTRDVAFFRAELHPAMWERLLLDKGYNATPVWTWIGGRLANLVPTTSRAGMQALAWLDPLLLALGCASVARAFGLRAMLFALALYLTHWCMGHAHFRAAFLRTDWLVALLAACSSLKRGAPAAAGGFCAYAGLVRVFPALFAFWAPLALGWSLVARARPDRAALRFLAGFALVAALFFGLTLVDGGGLAAWRGFAHKIAEHDARPAADTLGFRSVFLDTRSFDPSQGKELRALFAGRRAAWWTCQAFFLLVLAGALRRRQPHEGFALGFVLVYALAAPAYYYYALLLVPLCFLADAPERAGRALGLALVFGTGLCARALASGREITLALSYQLSLVMGFLALYLLALAWLERPRTAAGSRPPG